MLLYQYFYIIYLSLIYETASFPNTIIVNSIFIGIHVYNFIHFVYDNNKINKTKTIIIIK